MKLLSQGITNPGLGPNLQGKSGVGFFQTLLPAAVALALVVGALIFFFLMVSGAISWIASGGDKQGLETARGKITQAIVGLAILFSVFVIIKAIESFFGVSILSLDIGRLRVR